MQGQLSAHQFEEVYKNLGIDLGKLGCIMIDTDPIEVSSIIAEEDLYYAADPEAHRYIDGIVSEKVPHCTLLYGLLRSGPELQPHVDALLDGWQLEKLQIAGVTAFDSRLADEPYYCLVAELSLTAELVEGNARLRMLPHIDTFPAYRAHITLAYIRKDEERRDLYLDLLRSALIGREMAVRNINYGG